MIGSPRLRSGPKSHGTTLGPRAAGPHPRGAAPGGADAGRRPAVPAGTALPPPRACAGPPPGRRLLPARLPLMVGLVDRVELRVRLAPVLPFAPAPPTVHWNRVYRAHARVAVHLHHHPVRTQLDAAHLLGRSAPPVRDPGGRGRSGRVDDFGSSGGASRHTACSGYGNDSPTSSAPRAASRRNSRTCRSGSGRTVPPEDRDSAAGQGSLGTRVTVSHSNTRGSIGSPGAAADGVGEGLQRATLRATVARCGSGTRGFALWPSRIARDNCRANWCRGCGAS